MKKVNIEIERYSYVKEAIENSGDVAKAEEMLFKKRMDIANRIIQLRKEAGKMKQGELADLLLMSHNQLSRVETGNADLTGPQIHDLAKVFDVTTDFIINGDEKIVIDKEIAEILKDKNPLEIKKAIKMLKVLFDME